MRPVPRLHVVTDDEVLARHGILDLMSLVLEAGGPEVAVHVRGPRSPGALLFDVASRLAKSVEAGHGAVFVNDRLDVALAVGAAGVHLGRRSPEVSLARSLIGPDTVLGRSVHRASEAADAQRGGAQYVFVGTLYSTPSHPEAETPGPALVADTVRAVEGLSVVGIGGITSARVAAVLEAGASGVAVVRGIWEAESPADAVETYLSALAANQGEER